MISLSIRPPIIKCTVPASGVVSPPRESPQSNRRHRSGPSAASRREGAGTAGTDGTPGFEPRTRTARPTSPTTGTRVQRRANWGPSLNRLSTTRRRQWRNWRVRGVERGQRSEPAWLRAHPGLPTSNRRNRHRRKYHGMFEIRRRLERAMASTTTGRESYQNSSWLPEESQILTTLSISLNVPG